MHHSIAACGIETFSLCSIERNGIGTCIIALPLAALKPPLKFNRQSFILLHHSIAACGIETVEAARQNPRLEAPCIIALPLAALKPEITSRCDFVFQPCIIALPLAALKLGTSVSISALEDLHHSIAACGIETARTVVPASEFYLACIIALPLAALKPFLRIRLRERHAQSLHHSIAACGILRTAGI